MRLFQGLAEPVTDIYIYILYYIYPSKASGVSKYIHEQGQCQIIYTCPANTCRHLHPSETRKHQTKTGLVERPSFVRFSWKGNSYATKQPGPMYKSRTTRLLTQWTQQIRTATRPVPHLHLKSCPPPIHFQDLLKCRQAFTPKVCLLCDGKACFGSSEAFLHEAHGGGSKI